MSDSVRFIEGGIFTDHRGSIAHCNELDMDHVRRFYTIMHPDCSVVRAWHAHQDERKWFTVLRGSFAGAFVRIDDWDAPSSDLRAEEYVLSADRPGVLCVPKGYANGFKALERDSLMLVYSDKILSDAVLDSWRYDAGMWVDWSKF